MDENRISGTERKIEGSVQEGVGNAFGDTTAAARGRLKQAVGSAQDLYGKAVDATGDAVGAVQGASRSMESSLRSFIEDNPYTTAVIALGIGWLLGRSHRPL